MKEIEKKSIVLSKDISKRMEKYALNAHVSFSYAIRFACEKMLDSINPSEFEVNLEFSPDELSLLNKLAAGLQISKEAVLKACFEMAAPNLVEQVANKKQIISDLNKKI